jgi:hypothetical protein
VVDIQVLADPRIDAKDSDYDLQQDLLKELDENVREIHNSIVKVKSVQAQLESIMGNLKQLKGQEDLLAKAEGIKQSSKDWEAKLIQPMQKTFQDVINFENKLSAEMLNVISKIDAVDPKQPLALLKRIEELNQNWTQLGQELSKLIEEDLKAFNEEYRAAALPVLVYPNK